MVRCSKRGYADIEDAVIEVWLYMLCCSTVSWVMCWRTTLTSHVPVPREVSVVLHYLRMRTEFVSVYS